MNLEQPLRTGFVGTLLSLQKNREHLLLEQIETEQKKETTIMKPKVGTMTLQDVCTAFREAGIRTSPDTIADGIVSRYYPFGQSYQGGAQRQPPLRDPDKGRDRLAGQ